MRAWGEGGAGQGGAAGLWQRGPEGRCRQGQGKDAGTLGEASLLGVSLVLEPGEAGWLGPPTTHPPPHSCTSSTLGLEPSTPTPALGQDPAPGLAPGQGQW